MTDKRLQRLKQRPKDFTWSELLALLTSLGYESRPGRGSRRRFVDREKRKISLHEPHPQKVLKPYQVEDVLKVLEDHGKI